MNKCVCPEVMILSQHNIPEKHLLQIADLLNAQVTVTYTGTDLPLLGRTVWGKHRGDCPCGPVPKEEEISNGCEKCDGAGWIKVPPHYIQLCECRLQGEIDYID